MKIYIVKTIQIDNMEPSHYSTYRTETIEGIYGSEASAIAKMEELHDTYRAFELAHPEWNHIDETCTITEQELIP
jgi:hypothetical protein